MSCFGDGLELRHQLVEFGLRHLAHVRVGVGEHGLGFGDAVADPAVLAKLLDRGLQVAVLLGDLAVALLVVDQGGVGELAAKVFVTGFELIEAVEHGELLRGQGIGIGNRD